MSSGLIHYSTYQKKVRSMNISFAKLGEEECETCEKYKMHVHDSEGEGILPNVDIEKLRERGRPLPNEECNRCKTWVLHISKANLARKIYREDCKKQVNEKEAIFAADLEKVIMLPRPNAWF